MPSLGDWEMTFMIRDSEGSTAPLSLNFDGLLSPADLELIRIEATPVILALTDGVIASTAIQKLMTINGNLPVTHCDVEIGAKFIWQPEDTTKVHIHTIPAFKRVLLEPTTNDVILDQADVAQWITHMTAGFTGGVNPEDRDPRDSENRLLVSLKSAKENYQRARRR